MNERIDESLSGQLPAPANIEWSGSSFTFVAYGDIHEGQARGNFLNEAIDSAKGNGDLFALLLGDLSDNGGNGEFSAVAQLFSDKSFLYRSVLGNHDIFSGGWGHYKKNFGSSVYRFDVGSVACFFVLDSANGYIGSKQMGWLDGALDSCILPVKIIAMHTPVYVGPVRSLWQLASDEEGAQLKYLAYRHSVQLFLSGHYHGYLNRDLNGVDYVSTGGINRIPDNGDDPHYLRITVTSDRQIVIEKKVF